MSGTSAGELPKSQSPQRYSREPDRVAATGGRIRGARRPPGWTAPGPRPPGDPDADPTGPRPGEDLCRIAGDWRILQREAGHRWSMDDLVTAWFAHEVRAELPVRDALDIGCGIGSVLLCIAWKFPGAQCVGVEAQGASAELAERSVLFNGVTGRVRIVRGDLRDPEVIPNAPRFDLITGTPPYFPVERGRVSDVEQRAAARFELRGTVHDYAIAGASRLAPDGSLVLCHAWSESERVLAAIDAAGLSLGRWCRVVPRDGKPALLGLWEGRPPESRTGATEWDPLVVRDSEGRRTPRFVGVRNVFGMPP